jgi:hypothetical protein
MRDVYLQGISVPKYVLVAAEACGDDRGFNCGFFSVLVPGQRSGEHWNAATTAAHNLQKSKPPTNLGPRAASGTWDFMGEEPQPVSDACLKALPLDPGWGSGYVDYSQPITPLAPGAVRATPTSAGAASVPDISVFVGTWEGHQRVLEVHADGSASMRFAMSGLPSYNLTLQLITVTQTEHGAVASGQVVADDSNSRVGEAATLTLNDDGTVSPTLGGDEILDFCGPQAPYVGYCGA